jgi:hypothetical protein
VGWKDKIRLVISLEQFLEKNDSLFVFLQIHDHLTFSSQMLMKLPD